MPPFDMLPSETIQTIDEALTQATISTIESPIKAQPPCLVPAIAFTFPLLCLSSSFSPYSSSLPLLSDNARITSPIPLTTVPLVAVRSALEAAKALIADPDNWCRGTLAKRRITSSPSPAPILIACGPEAPDVSAFCAIGAIQRLRALGNYRCTVLDAAYILLNKTAEVMGFTDAARLNDSARSHADVMRLFDRAIEACE